MSLPDLLSAITTVGFPIVCCGAMMWYVKYSTDKNREDIANLNAQHKAEMADVTTAVNNNTLALTRLCERLDSEHGNTSTDI